mmetsp:Transcript_17169/g.25421  ORF Transcript_17169/g.25421 Transcript_17169/m.25421 type:complete len:275 (+) Transcript_17169:40-864(+)
MVLFFVGLGLGNEKDITLRGLEAVKTSSKVYLERYTSVLGVDKSALEKLYGKPILYADRETVESNAETIFEKAEVDDVAFLVVGDPLCATTHTDLMIRAKQRNIAVEVIHNTSIMGAVASCGLQLYNFGQTVSLCLWDKDLDWTPSSYYEKIKYNIEGGMHTLCLLDIKMKEPDFSEMSKGRIKYMSPQFMNVNQALSQLLEVEEERKEGVITNDTLVVGLARVGQPSQKIISGKIKDMIGIDFGPPLHSLIIVGNTHPLEREALEMFSETINT